ncbi:hypothetical protein [Pandoraea sp. PE-S2R-1]|uniref:hypothetical protein n=1 Tax=Pandoraea sp. PE-S2R-1 TaxID=1986994 RepID=UPI0020165806|nr:hypothetical protein [Pandoraea sp. PE-S2R-1]
MRANVEWVSQGIYESIPTEDVVGCLTRKNSLLAWAIDGASTLTESPFTTYEDVSDAGWLARALADLLKAKFRERPFDMMELHRGLQILREQYLIDARETPSLSAWPVAAAIILEINQTSPRQLQLHSYSYADCFALVSQKKAYRDMNVAWPLPQLPLDYDPWKPFSGFQGQTLEQLLQRRCRQQANECGTALTLNPDSARNAVEEHRTIHTPAHIVLGSDGLSRIWDTYQIMTSEEALDVVTERGLPSLMRVLRTFEATTSTRPNGIKQRDDACGIHISFA